MALTLDSIHRVVQEIVKDVKEGEPLSELDAVLVGLAVRASPSALDVVGVDKYVRLALDAGATSAQVHETLVLVSGLGVHTLMAGSPIVASVLLERNDPLMLEPFDSQRQKLWSTYIGNDPFWNSMEREVPGFLESLLRQSPDAFEAFFQYCAVPWKTAALRAYIKELISLAVDASPTHRFLPGLRLHLANALQLGVGRKAILQTLAIAAAAPAHEGVI
ncbi:carboxymuconolactone decarboxylase family protein [Halopseudomonas xiamenensis]|uniref:carboxymuconolactone decarboxylase family protein n=1 Tax=Halopseudomonas xiamenensis TaxID=157792 RepID=UPI001628930C|nr:carboxymuconolactone decarboxylase family protein [Halopseudomonas xiamenensis]